MEDKKRRAYIIGQTKGFDAKERFETAEKFLRGFRLEVFNPESFERYISGFTKDDEEIEDFKLWYIKECDVAYMLDGYEQSPEAARAYRAARVRGLDMAYEQKGI